MEDPLNSLENSIKVRRKQLDALLDDRLLQAKRDEEAALRAKVAADPQFAAAIGDPWSDIAKAQLRERELYLPYTFLELGAGFNSRLFTYARTLVRGAAERPKPNTDRLREYRDAALPRVVQRLTAAVPVYPALDKLTLSFALERMREWLGPDAPIVRQLLAKDSPDTLAARLVDGSQLADPKLRQRLWDGGAAALDAAHDPMIELARSVDAPARTVRKSYEDEVEAPVDAASEKIARARFRVYGTSVPPDATFTLRLNVGSVQGWKEDGREIEPFTYLSRLFERATGQEPFRIPDSWLKVKTELDPQTRFDLSTNNDIVGGNSGSPLIDTGGRLVGLMFDGNIHSIAGSYWFDPELNRAVAVDPAVMFEALRKVYKTGTFFLEPPGMGSRRPRRVQCARGRARHEAEPHAHLVLHLQCTEQGAERREPDIALPQRGLAGYDDCAGGEAVARRHADGAHLPAHRGLHPGQHRPRLAAGFAPGARRRLPGRLEPHRAQHDLRVALTVEQRLPEHVAPRSLPGAVRHLGREIGAVLLRA